MIKTGMVVGTANSSVWSQVVIKPLSSGNLIMVVKLSYPGEGELISLSQIGVELLQSLKEKLTQLREIKLVEREIGNSIAGIGEGIKASVAVMIFEKDRLILAGMGDVEAYIVRDGKVGRIFSGLGVIEGLIKEGDIYALTSVDTPSAMGLKKWKEIILKGMSGLEELAVNVHGKGESGGMVSAIAQVKMEETISRKGLDLANVKSWINSIWEKPLTIRREQLKVNAWVGTVLSLILLVGVVFGVIKRASIVKENAFNDVKSQVDQRVTEARSVGDLNPERAKFLLNSARDEINVFLKDNIDEKYINQASELTESITQAESSIFKKEEVKTNIFIETNLIKSGFEPKIIILDDEANVLLAEKNKSTVGGVSLKDKSSWDLDLEGVETILDISIFNDKLFILNSTGVYTAQESKAKTEKVIEPDDLWSEVAFIDNYGGNAYLLDKGQGEIWKYPVLSDGYGARRRWLGAGITLDFSNVTDFALDGDIWLITSSGKLEQYRRGVPIDFVLEGFPYAEQGRLSNPTALFLSEEKVYVAEAGAKRVVVFDKKSGKYENQYVNEEFAQARGLVVYDNRCYVLTQGRIIWFEL